MTRFISSFLSSVESLSTLVRIESIPLVDISSPSLLAELCVELTLSATRLSTHAVCQSCVIQRRNLPGSYPGANLKNTCSRRLPVLTRDEYCSSHTSWGSSQTLTAS